MKLHGLQTLQICKLIFTPLVHLILNYIFTNLGMNVANIVLYLY